ncbi:MAG TPA: hypothetical protein VFV53_10350 [Candidatus Limnocylindrales bacterium]|nr:hypothetical protein [Candidatus Limnocylindrales bacterium]
MDGDELVRDYIGRLEAASWPLPPDRRAELAGEVREHIETALAEAGRRDDVTVRNVLERLGRPEEIVATEVDAELPPTPWAGGRARVAVESTWGAVEIAAIFFLTVGAFIAPGIGPALGLVLVWLSRRWTTREKMVATSIAVVIFVLPIVLLLGTGARVSSG